MIRLFRVEVRRLLARRLLLALGAALLAGLTIGAVTTALHSSRDLAGARAKAERQVAEYKAQGVEREKSCEGEKAAGRIPAEVNCLEQGDAPPVEAFYADPRFHFARSASGPVNGAIVGVGVLGVVLGASAIGAEWSAGTFAGLLTWEPRRLRVLAAKLLALAALVVAIATVAVAVQLLVYWAIAGTRGTLAGTTSHVVRDLIGRGARGVGVVGLLSVAAASTAGILRSTAGALGAAAGYLVAFEILGRNLRPGWARWLLSSNAGAVVDGRVAIYPPQRFSGSSSFGPPIEVKPFILHGSRAAIVVSLATAALVALWALLLRRRDVT